MNRLRQPGSRSVPLPPRSPSTSNTAETVAKEPKTLQVTQLEPAESISQKHPPSNPSADKQDYQKLKSQLQQSKARQAEILWEVKTRELYYLEYRSFEKFCEAELGYGRRQCDRMANWGRVRLVTRPTGPARESHARPLNSIKENETVQRVWKEVHERHESITADAVREVVREFTTTETSRNTSDGPEGDCGGDKGSPDSGNESEDSQNNPDRSEEESCDSGSESGDADSVPDEGCFLLLPGEEAVPDSTESLKIAGGRRLVDCKALSDKELKTVVLSLEADSQPVSQSSSEEGIADSLFAPLVQSLQEFSARLSEDSNPTRAIFRPKRLGRIQSQRCRGKRALISPAVDIFSPVVPDSVARLILKSLENGKLTPVLYTEHLKRASSFSLPDELWIGTKASRSNLGDTHRRLSKIPDSVGKWILYDLGVKDGTEGLPVPPSNADWIVYDPPGGAGVSLTIAQINNLISDAENCGASWSFRGSFKTSGASFPE